MSPEKVYSSAFGRPEPLRDRFALLFALIGVAVSGMILFWQGLSIVAVVFFLSLIILLFLIRIDIAFYSVIILWMTLISISLPIASPFTPTEKADLPIYEVIMPVLGLCLLARIAMQRARVSSSPLNIPLLVWFGLIILTYFRNPIFLGDLFGKGGTGAIYHTVYPLFLGGIFYISAASILKTEDRIILTAKTVFIVMLVGMLFMTFMLVTGWNVPFLSEGRAPWAVTTRTHGGETVYRIMAMGSYSSMLFLALLCFGSDLKKPLQLLIAALLVLSLVLSGGRAALIVVCIYVLLSFIIQPRTRWLIGWLSLLLVISFALVMLVQIRLPYTTRRIVTFSSDTRMGMGGRISMAEISWQAVKKRPFLGYGYGQLWKYFPRSSISKQVASGDPHAGVLAVMTASGLIGVCAFLWVILTAIKTGWTLYKNIEHRFLKQLMLWVVLNLGVSLVMFFVSAQTERSFFTYLEMGIISSMYAMYLKKRRPSDLANSETGSLPKLQEMR